MPNEILDKQFYDGIKRILADARAKVYSVANFAMVEAYWEIGKSIVEKQGGKPTAEYGTGLLKELSKQMTADFGKGFTVANLKNMRQFYLTFPNRYTLCSQLSWSHYRQIMRVEDEKASAFYSRRNICCICRLKKNLQKKYNPSVKRLKKQTAKSFANGTLQI